MLTKRELELFKLLAESYKAFCDPKRLIIINELRKGQKSVGDLVRILATPQAAVSRHLAVLRQRGIVDARREGANVFYSLSDPLICEACDVVQRIVAARIEKHNKLVEWPMNS
ncbi:MAG TPA: metalloregulator ArsR/SmtB family transcription factor [Dehalococcoidales bacterium]